MPRITWPDHLVREMREGVVPRHRVLRILARTKGHFRPLIRLARELGLVVERHDKGKRYVVGLHLRPPRRQERAGDLIEC